MYWFKCLTLFLSTQTMSTFHEIQPKQEFIHDDTSEASFDESRKSVIVRNVVTNSHAYEAFLSKKEEKPKTLSSSSASNAAATFEPAGVRPRKPCNCTKSQCLKL